MGAIPSEKGGERFPHSPPKCRIWGEGGRPAATPWRRSDRGGVRERKRGWGRRGRRGPRTLALSRQPVWRDNACGVTGWPRQDKWRDQTCYSLQIKINTG